MDIRCFIGVNRFGTHDAFFYVSWMQINRASRILITMPQCQGNYCSVKFLSLVVVVTVIFTDRKLEINYCSNIPPTRNILERHSNR